MKISRQQGKYSSNQFNRGERESRKCRISALELFPVTRGGDVLACATAVLSRWKFLSWGVGVKQSLETFWQVAALLCGFYGGFMSLGLPTQKAARLVK